VNSREKVEAIKPRKRLGKASIRGGRSKGKKVSMTSEAGELGRRTGGKFLQGSSGGRQLEKYYWGADNLETGGDVDVSEREQTPSMKKRET